MINMQEKKKYQRELKPKCTQKNNAYFVCCSKECLKNAFMCSDTSCQCQRFQHSDCKIRKIQKIVKHCQEKVRAIHNARQIIGNLEKAIKKKVEEIISYLDTIKNQAKFVQLLEMEVSFCSMVFNNNCNINGLFMSKLIEQSQTENKQVKLIDDYKLSFWRQKQSEWYQMFEDQKSIIKEQLDLLEQQNINEKKKVQIFQNNNKYDGEIIGKMKNGKGTYIENGNRYEGDWKNNKKHGKGIYYYASGSKYNGQWREDKKHGRGKYTWLDGDIYQGQYKDNQRNGKGIYICVDQTKYEGEWKNDMKHGKGIITQPNGDKYQSEWKKDERIKYKKINMIQDQHYS